MRQGTHVNQILTRDKAGNRLKSDSPEANPTSVIHAPKDYLSFKASSPPNYGRTTPTPSQLSDITAHTPQKQGPIPNQGTGDGDSASTKDAPLSPPIIDTAVRPVHDPYETPRASTRIEVEQEQRRRGKGRAGSLENIPEDCAVEDDDQPQSAFFESEADRQRRSDEEVAALKDALSECWTLCNTLAGLSSLHRERAFRRAQIEDGREQAWKSCWKLCQKLYESRDEDSNTEVSPTLDLCRDFCLSLFEVRQKGDEVADSVLRVSFELNNHLYNTHDRSLPDAFRERTLDFYITLCHRLMKQRHGQLEETDSLLRACWGLAEMLFSLRQNRRDGKPPNEELLGSAVQACWDLCDLFREGWTQVRPDRGTPRPSSIGFNQPFSVPQSFDMKSVATISVAESSDGDGDDDDDEGRMNPETPTTIFEDVNQFSPDGDSVPNILVLGPEASDHPLPSWSSSVSDVSSVSSYRSPQGSRSNSRASSKLDSGPMSGSSTGTVTNPGLGPGSSISTNNASDDARLACLKLLIVRAAMIAGFQRARDPDSLQKFVKAAPSTSFGTAPWQTRLLEDYKKLVAGDAAFRSAGPATRASAQDVARAVRWMVRSGQYVWLEDLYRWVIGFRMDEARERRNVWVQT